MGLICAKPGWGLKRRELNGAFQRRHCAGRGESAFVRVEGLTSEDSGMTYGLSYDFNKIPGLTAGVHAAMMELNERWMPTAGLHGGLRF